MRGYTYDVRMYLGKETQTANDNMTVTNALWGILSGGWKKMDIRFLWTSSSGPLHIWWCSYYKNQGCGSLSVQDEWSRIPSPVVGKDFHFTKSHPHQPQGQPSLFQWVPRLFLRKGTWGVELTTHLYLVLRLRESMAVPLLALCIFMACYKKNFTFTIKSAIVVLYIQTVWACISSNVKHDRMEITFRWIAVLLNRCKNCSFICLTWPFWIAGLCYQLQKPICQRNCHICLVNNLTDTARKLRHLHLLTKGRPSNAAKTVDHHALTNSDHWLVWSVRVTGWDTVHIPIKEYIHKQHAGCVKSEVGLCVPSKNNTLNLYCKQFQCRINQCLYN